MLILALIYINFYKKGGSLKIMNINKPHKNTESFINKFFNNKSGTAIDLGAGDGSDTFFLLDNNWNVIAIDKKANKNLLNANIKYNGKLKYIISDFYKCELEEADLVIANNSLPFCNKDSISPIIIKIKNSLEKNKRIFHWNFFWKKR